MQMQAQGDPRETNDTSEPDDTADTGTFARDQEKAIADLVSGIGSRERPPYQGGRGYTLLPEDMQANGSADPAAGTPTPAVDHGEAFTPQAASIGKRELPPYRGGRGYTRLPEDKE